MVMEELGRVPFKEITREALGRMLTYYFLTAPDFKLSLISGDFLVNFSQLQPNLNLVYTGVYGHVADPSPYWAAPGGHLDRLIALVQRESHVEIVRGVVRCRVPIGYVISMAGTKISMFTHSITSQGVSKLQPFNPHNRTIHVLLDKGAEVEYTMEGQMAVK